MKTITLFVFLGCLLNHKLCVNDRIGILFGLATAGQKDIADSVLKRPK
jgi:hypothetical protein